MIEEINQNLNQVIRMILSWYSTIHNSHLENDDDDDDENYESLGWCEKRRSSNAQTPRVKPEMGSNSITKGALFHNRIRLLRISASHLRGPRNQQHTNEVVYTRNCV